MTNNDLNTSFHSASIANCSAVLINNKEDYELVKKELASMYEELWNIENPMFILLSRLVRIQVQLGYVLIDDNALELRKNLKEINDRIEKLYHSMQEMRSNARDVLATAEKINYNILEIEGEEILSHDYNVRRWEGSL